MRKDSHVDRRITPAETRQSDKTIAPTGSPAPRENDQAHHYAPGPSCRAIAGRRVLEPADDLGLARRRRPAGGNQKDGARKQGAVPSPNRRIKIGPSTGHERSLTQALTPQPSHSGTTTAGTIRNAVPTDYFDTARRHHGSRILNRPELRRFSNTLRGTQRESYIEHSSNVGGRSGRRPAGKGPLKDRLQAKVGKGVFEV